MLLRCIYAILATALPLWWLLHLNPTLRQPFNDPCMHTHAPRPTLRAQCRMAMKTWRNC